MHYGCAVIGVGTKFWHYLQRTVEELCPDPATCNASHDFGAVAGKGVQPLLSYEKRGHPIHFHVRNRTVPRRSHNAVKKAISYQARVHLDTTTAPTGCNKSGRGQPQSKTLSCCRKRRRIPRGFGLRLSSAAFRPIALMVGVSRCADQVTAHSLFKTFQSSRWRSVSNWNAAGQATSQLLGWAKPSPQ